MIGEIFFTLFIWPIYFILEFLFVLFNRIFFAPGYSVIFLSIVVSTLTLPLYIIADRWQKEERELQNSMKAKLKKIRAHFKGDERQMIMNAYYRQTGYSYVSIFKSSAGLLLQIPFFIAAYQFLSRTSMLTGVSFFFISDLNVQDALIKLPFPIFRLTALNLMPILMTALNILSALIYAKDYGRRERIQLYAMALVFLVLLYSTPSGLVLYWTMNNFYSLIKNLCFRYVKKPQLALKFASILFGVIFLFFIWTGKANVERYKMMFSAIALLAVLIPLFWNRVTSIFIIKTKEYKEEPNIGTNTLYIMSFALLFLLAGFLNPAQVLSSSVSDFEQPLVFFVRTFLQGFSFLLIIPIFIRAFTPEKVRRVIALGAAVISLNALVCYFALFTYYGIMDINFKLDDTNRLLTAFPLWINIIVPLIIIALIYFIYKINKLKFLIIIFQVLSVAVFILGTIDFVTLIRRINHLDIIMENSASNSDIVFNLSRTQQNIFIISLDRAQGSAFTDMLKYKRSFYNDLDGFIFYPNTISFGNSTILGVPSMLGGYSFTPDKINKAANIPLIEKVNSAITTMPRKFSEAGYRVTITDPVIANLNSVADTSIFKGMRNVNAYLLSGKMTDRYRTEFPYGDEDGIHSFNFDILFRYGIFRMSPPALRYGIYYKGQWWREAAYNSYGRAVGEFSSLYYLNDICNLDNGDPTLNIMLNFITHEGGNYNRDFLPQQEPVDFNDDELSVFKTRENAEYIFIMIAAFNQLVKWFNFLKSEGVYDNTKFIIVSDHGGNYITDSQAGMEGYNPILLLKDFNKRGDLEINEEFMTHSDILYLAAEGTEIDASYSEAIEAKNEVLQVFSAVSSQPLRHGPYRFNFAGRRELRGREVLESDSWGEWERD
ncbi:MAG: membrane protein insertase YidC [Treponema sp.]|nr:membrane protein insertase YidC [Treponema sp.]